MLKRAEPIARSLAPGSRPRPGPWLTLFAVGLALRVAYAWIAVGPGAQPFSDPADYDKVCETDRITLANLSDLAPGVPVTAVLAHADGRVDAITLRHSLNNEQIAWFRAGSALNLLRRQEGEASGSIAPPPA